MKMMNTRFKSLFEMTGTGDMFVTDKDFSALDRKYEAKGMQFSEHFLTVLNKKVR